YAFDAANAGAYHHAGGAAILLRLRLPARISQCQVRGSDTVDDELADLALFLGFEEFIDVEGVLAFARNDVGDLARKIVRLELIDAACGTTTGQQSLPAGFHTLAEGRKQPQTGYDDASHVLQCPIAARNRGA